MKKFLLKSMGIKVVEDESPPIERLLQYKKYKDRNASQNLYNFFHISILLLFYDIAK